MLQVLGRASHVTVLLMTAHNADFTHDYFKLGWDIWKANLAAFQRMEKFVTLVDKECGY